MADKPKRAVFQFRACVSLLTAMSFVGMTLSGIFLYVAPVGRAARDQNWSIWTLSRNDWGALHLTFSAVFIMAALVHLWLNRRSLMTFLKIKVKGTVALRWEWLAVLLLTILIIWGTLAPFEPFSSVLRWRDQFRHPTAAQQPSDALGER